MTYDELKRCLEARVAQLMRGGMLFGSATVKARREMGIITSGWIQHREEPDARTA